MNNFKTGNLPLSTDFDNTVQATQIDIDRCLRVATIVQQVGGLPHIPVCDWATRTAQALLRKNEPAAATVTILDTSVENHPWTPTHAGAWTEPAGPARERLLCDASRFAIEPWQGNTLQRVIDPSAVPAFSAIADGAGALIESGVRCSDNFACLVRVWRNCENIAPAQAAETHAAARLLASTAASLMGANGRPEWITERETVVLELLAEGLTVAQIAQKLKRSAYTVHDQVKSLYRKLRVHTRAELVRLFTGDRSATMKARDAALLIESRPVEAVLN